MAAEECDVAEAVALYTQATAVVEPEEEFDLSSPDFDPKLRIARILKERKVYSIDTIKRLSSTGLLHVFLLLYLLDNNYDQGFIKDLLKTEPSSSVLAASVFAGKFGRELGVPISCTGIDADDVFSVVESIGKGYVNRIHSFDDLDIVLPGDFQVDDDQKNTLERKLIVDEQDIFDTVELDPNLRMVSSVVYDLVRGFEDRLEYINVGHSDELAQLATIATSLRRARGRKRGEIIGMVGDVSRPLSSLLPYSFYLASGVLNGVESVAVVDEEVREHTIMIAYGKGMLSKMKKEFEALHAIKMGYRGIVGKICDLLEDRVGVVFDKNRSFHSKGDYNVFRRKLRVLNLKLYRQVDRNPSEFKEKDIVRTERATSRYPLGSIANLSSFLHTGKWKVSFSSTWDYHHFDVDDLQVLERVEFGNPFGIKNNDYVEIVGGDYSVENGSRARVLSVAGGKAKIKVVYDVKEGNVLDYFNDPRKAVGGVDLKHLMYTPYGGIKDGDEIFVRRNHLHDFVGRGTWGRVLRSSRGRAEVEFPQVTSEDDGIPLVLDIPTDYLCLFKPGDDDYTEHFEGFDEEMRVRDDIVGALDSIIYEAEAEIREKDSKIRGHVQKWIYDLYGLGVSDSAIGMLFSIINVSNNFFSGQLMDESLFKVVDGLVSRLNYREMVDEINHQLMEEFGVLVNVPRYVSSQTSFNKFKNRLLNLSSDTYVPVDGPLRRGDFLVTVRALNGGVYSDGTTVNKLPVGVVGKFDSYYNGYEPRFLALVKKEDYQYDGYKLNGAEMQRVERVDLIPCLHLREGDEVVVNFNDVMEGWNEKYWNQRNSLIPKGTKGVVAKFDASKNKYTVKFPSKVGWRTNWRNLTSDTAHFRGNELILPGTDKNELERERDELKDRLSSIVSGVEARYESLRMEIADKSLETMAYLRFFGHSDAKIISVLEGNLSRSAYTHIQDNGFFDFIQR